MHGSRPELLQLRQLILAAVVITGTIVIIAGIILCLGLGGFSQSAATAISIAKIEVALWTKADNVMRSNQFAIDVLA